MIDKFFKDRIIKTLGHKPTNSQYLAIDKLFDFINDREKFCVFNLKGYAGTGKTSLISALVKVLNEIKIKTVLLAPTGRAAKVLSNYSNKRASTIHKCIYRKKTTKKANSNFDLNFNAHKDTIFIVDEASMISNNEYGNNLFGSGRLLDDLLSFVFNDNNCRLILLGDTAQLPPIGTNLSPALDDNYLRVMGMKIYSVELTDVVRQDENSGILENANLIRNILADKNYKLPKIELKEYNDIKNISGVDLLDELESCYSKYGENETKIICRSNKYANKYNLGIRNRILWKEEDISYGDLLMVVKNNYSWLPKDAEIDFIANGDIIEVIGIGKRYELYGHKYIDLTVKFIDYPNLEIDVKAILDTINIEAPAMNNNYYSDLYQQLQIDYEDIADSNKRHEEILKDPYYNALQIKFAYALTCHKSQGGQWKAVFIDYGWLNFDNMQQEEIYQFLRWLYTAFTRPTEKLYMVNFSDKIIY